MATITVHRGLNIEENREPLIEITQAWTKNDTASPVSCNKNKRVKSKITSNAIWKQSLEKQNCIPRINRKQFQDVYSASKQQDLFRRIICNRSWLQWCEETHPCKGNLPIQVPVDKLNKKPSHQDIPWSISNWKGSCIPTRSSKMNRNNCFRREIDTPITNCRLQGSKRISVVTVLC